MALLLLKKLLLQFLLSLTDFIQNKAGFDADLIWGNGKDESLGENISVTIIASGFNNSSISEIMGNKKIEIETHDLTGNTISPENRTKKEPHEKEQFSSSSQKIIEFNITEEEKQENADFETLYPNTSKERNSTNDKNPKVDYSSMSDEDVDELENIPAYKRRQIRMNDPRYKKKVSKYSVTRDNKISDRNSFLHNKVD